jgi:CHAT domain-containing protein
MALCAAPCFAPQAPLLDRLAAIRNDDERIRLLDAESSSLNAALVAALARRADDAFAGYDFAAAIEMYRSVMAVADRLHDPAAASGARMNVGRCLFRTNQSAEAIEMLHSALAISDAAHLDASSALAWRILSSVYQQGGQFAEALDAAGRSRQLYHAAGDQAGEAGALFNTANTQFRRGQYRLAAEAYEECLRLAEGLNATTVNQALTNLASLYSEQGDYDVALSYLERVTQSAAFQQMAPHLKSVTLGILGTTYRRLGRYAEAQQTLERAMPLARQGKDRSEEANLLISLATVRYYMGHNREALADYQQASEIAAAEHRPGIQIYALNDISLSYLDLNQPDMALQKGQEALAIARRLNSPSSLWEPLNAVGKACRRLNHRAEAEAAFLEAITNIESLRAELAGGDQEGRSFFSGMLAPYNELVAMRTERKDAEGALAMAERAKAHQLLDVLARGKTEITQAMSPEEKAREQALAREAANRNDALEGKANPDAAGVAAFEKAARELEAFRSALYVAHPELKVRRGRADPLTLAEAAALVPNAGTVLLEFSVTDDGVFLFVLEHSSAEKPSLSVYQLAVPGKRLTAEIESFRRQLASRDLDYRIAAQGLYRELLGPAEARLKGKSIVGIIPDGPLWDLPFQALIPPGGKSLLEQMAVFYASSLTVLRETLRRGRDAAPPERTLLAMGPPDAGLPQATAEVRELGKLYGPGAVDIYAGTEASEQRWKAAAPRYRILHLATHGVLNANNPMFSYLKLARGTDASEDGMLEAREIADLDLRAELAVLSACETARGELRSGEGVVGMSWALMMAGTPAVVVSQWKVDSASTTQLMLALHRNLHRGLSAAPIAGKAEALRKAAMEVAANPRYQHPFYWAGFAMLGNGY